MTNPIVLQDLLNGGWKDLPFQPFKEGVEIYSIVQGEPALALLKYAPGASVPHHFHTDLETIFILAGSQSDDSGTYRAGTLIANPKGSSHSVHSDQGCVVLIQWTKPVQFLPQPTTEHEK